MKTLKKIGSILVDVLVIAVFLFSALLVVANVTVDKEKGEQPNVFGYVINSVQSDSMSGTFEKGDLVIGKIPDANTQIVVGESIITFQQQAGDIIFYNTHRVVDSKEVNGRIVYQTQGDNRETNPTPDIVWKHFDDITAVYVGKVPVVGSVIDFLKTGLGFVLVIVLPMLAFIAYQVYKLISIYVASKKEEMLQEAKDGVSDEAKDAIIKEYLEKMQQAEKAESNDKE